MASKFYALLTTRGEAKLAQAVALGTQLKITQMAVGDGGGAIPTPNSSQTKLINQQRIAAINTLIVDPVNTSQIIAEQVIPEDEGGWWIREVGLYDDAGELIAVANCAETYKPLLAEGSGRTQVIRMVVVVSSTEAVTIKIDPSVVLATRKYVDDKVIEVKAYTDSVMKAHLDAADPHPQYAPKASPTFSGTPKAPTPANGNNSTQLATTQFVQAAIGLLKGDAPATLDTLVELAAAINNDPAFYSTMASQLALKAAVAGPTFTGIPKAPTAAVGNNSTQLATTQFVQSAIAQLVASSPAALDTLKELADALGNDPNFATTITNQLALKAPLASPALTGTPTAPTAGVAVNNTQIATTAFVQAILAAHLAAADPHTQYAPKQAPTFSGGAVVNGALAVNGGGSYAATLTMGYRQIFQRDGAPGYQTFARTDITAAPTADTELGRVLFGYGMSGTDSWGTGGTLGYLNAMAMAAGGGKVNLVALNAAFKNSASITLDGNAGAVSVLGDVTFSGAVNFNGIINANRHDSCINFSSSDSTKPVITVNYSGAGNFGFWDSTNNGWVLRKDVANNWYMYAGLTVVGAATLGDGSTAVTQGKLDDSTKIATTAFVQSINAPVGIPMPWPTATPPTGWLKCNGAAFSSADYPELAKAYPTLKLPDLRGEFIRGWDDGRGADSGRELLSAQGHALQQHTHTVAVPLRTTDTDRGSLDSTYSVDNTQTVTSSGASGNTATETRPRNVAFNYIVRAA